MSTYSKYIEYAKAAIGELKQLETLKKSHKGAKLAQAIKEKGLKKITKSHVDSVLHGLGKNSDYSPLTDSQKEIAKELQDIGEKVALTHKDKAIAGVLEKVSIDTLKLGMVQEMLTQENDLKAVITAISNLKKDPNYYSISELTYKQWMDSNSTGVGDEDHPINRDNPHVNKLKAENAEMAQSDITKIIDYSEKLRSMFNVNDNLEDWVKAKLNHACDYVATVRDYLKFYSEEKAKGTQNIEEKWTNAYKKSIDCSNAKGFSQKAHCRARQLRKAGKHTKSKPVKESYKEAIQELLKEQNSSMAMGALKQLNSDAKELQSMLQPNTQLEDWVKSKLNLAGEYLDDVYHHLDHFGPQGRKLDEGYYEDQERRQRERMLRFNTTISPEKKYWFKPDGTVVEAGYSHEEWIRKNDPSLVGPTLVDTYDNAVKKGYIRAVLDLNHNFLTLSNMQNYDFSMNGDANKNIPAVNSSVKNSIKDFIAEKGILLTATGKGKIIKDLSSLDESQITEDWKKTLATTALAAATAFGGSSSLQAKTKAPTSPTTITRTVSVKEPSSNSSFADYLKYVENGNKVGYDKNKKLWFPHKSVEGGSDTIAYGHKIQSGEDFSAGITDTQAEDLFKKDIEKAKSQINKELKGTKLTPKQEEMFIDFVFNMGTLKKFPKFTEFALKNDLEGMKDQYKRYAGGKELKGRNTAFARRYLDV
jgi:GH24 family phage-related lysozyme (muramidase)